MILWKISSHGVCGLEVEAQKQRQQNMLTKSSVHATDFTSVCFHPHRAWEGTGSWMEPSSLAKMPSVLCIDPNSLEC